MAVPGFQMIMRPLLAFSADGAEKNINDCISALIQQFQLSEEDRVAKIASGKQTVFANRVHWARTYLDKAGAIKKTKRSHFSITERGINLLKENPQSLTVKILKQFPEFLEFHTAKPPPKSTEQQSTPVVDEDELSTTPDERIAAAVSEIQARLEGEILDRIAEKSPTFFESLVVDLIVAMGYGGTRENVVQQVGKSGDEGIDGIVNEDALGLDVVYIQAKRYSKEQVIGREKIQQFTGALVGKGAIKGVFVATCGYSKGAIEYAQKVPQRIILIDGKQLARLLIRYGVGIRVEQEFQVKRIDLDYFEEEEI